MVELGSTVVGSDGSGAVELEVDTGGINSNGQGLVYKVFFHTLNIIVVYKSDSFIVEYNFLFVVLAGGGNSSFGVYVRIRFPGFDSVDRGVVVSVSGFSSSTSLGFVV